MKSVYLKLDPNFLFFNWIPFWALLIWRSIFVTVERDVCVWESERERSGISSVVVSLHNTLVNLFLFESVLFSFFTLSFYCLCVCERERERDQMLYRWSLIYCVGYAGSSGAGSPPWIEHWCLYNYWRYLFRCSRPFYCNFPRV